jgi:LCP family protein required for cell wall assembly
VVAGALTTLLFLASSSAMAFLWYADRQIERIDIPELAPEGAPAEGEDPEPVNVLILGNDTRDVLTEEEQARKGTPEDVDGERSDTMILAHFDPARERAVLVHLPRDLRVEIPGHGLDKINAAFAIGGPGLAVRTVRGFAGVPIHHYVEVDFNGFRSMVEALGGVEVCVDRPMYDELAELDLPEAGCYRMDGDTALAFVRARHVEGDEVPDFARIARQQQFIRAVMNKVFSPGSLWRLPDLVLEASRNVTTDADVTATDLIQIGRQLQGLAEADPTGASTVDLRVVPAYNQVIDGIWYVIAEEEATRKLFRRIRQGRPLGDIGTVAERTPPSPAQIRVRVLTRDGEDAAPEVEQLLRDAGFVVLPTKQAPRRFTESVIVHDRNEGIRAEVVGGYFPELAQRVGPLRLLAGAEVGVVVAGEVSR